MNEQGKIWYKLRGLLIAPLYFFSVFCFWGEVESHWLILLGGCFFFAGLVLRIWSQMHLHYRLKVHKVLTTTGPYTYVRNPIYIGNTLILVGTTVLSELLWVVPIMIACCAITYILVVRYEEDHLTKKYGDQYLEYLKSVPRWCPRVGNIVKVPIQNLRTFIYPSIKAEMHILLLLVPFVLKELITSYWCQ